MAQNQPIIPLLVDDKPSTLLTPSVTSENTTSDVTQPNDVHSSVPWPGRTFMIQSRANGQVITFLNGEIILDKPGGLGTYRWRCVESKGWMGFQDPASAKYIGYNKDESIRCTVDKHEHWEYLCPRKRPEGGYLILVFVMETLIPIGVRPISAENGVQQKVRILDWKSDGIVWDFIEV
jgi:hypothetical protein